MSRYGVMSLISLCYLLGLPALDPFRPSIVNPVFKNFHADVNQVAGLIYDHGYRVGRAAIQAVPQMAGAAAASAQVSAPQER